MEYELNLIEKRNFLESEGYDIQPVTRADGFKVVVWRGEKCLGEGRFTYKDWHLAVNKTIKDLYNKITTLNN